MNPNALPAQCDVLVVGAGPAGSACAQFLAKAGVDVVLVDQHNFPRDKVCGDGLIPDAHAALKRLGVYDEVMAMAQPATHVACIAPRGGRVDVPGTVAVLPRKLLDDVLCRAAVKAGAKLHTPVRFMAPLMDGGRVVGARLKSGDEERELRARWVVIASGAVPQALMAAGMCLRRTPSGVALRGYVRNERMRHRITALEVVWHQRLSGGYGWIFPGPDGVFNIGTGLADSHLPVGDASGSMKEAVNLREMFATFCEVYPPAAELIKDGEVVGELKGAPLRCSLEGADVAKPGLLVTGEAAGSTYSFSGEGIGKAMETGILAAESLLKNAGLPQPAQDVAARSDDAAVCAQYQAELARLKPRFDLYKRANSVNAHPWLADLVIWRARKSQRILRRMSAVLEETGNPGNLVSVRGMVKLFVPIR